MSPCIGKDVLDIQLSDKTWKDLNCRKKAKYIKTKQSPGYHRGDNVQSSMMCTKMYSQSSKVSQGEKV